MAGRGPAPRDPSQRRRRNAGPEREELPLEHAGRYPKLPATYTVQVATKTGGGRPKRVTYLKATRGWYDTWARSPMAVKFTLVEWNRLRMLAPIVDAHLRDPAKELLAEIRLQESLLGATPMDRHRMNLSIRTGGGQRPAEPERPLAPVRRLRAVDPDAVARS